MRLHKGIYFLITILSLSSFAKSDWKYYSKNEVDLIIQKKEALTRRNDLDYLRFAKYFILKGNIELAEHFLRRINYKNKKVTLIKDRYQSLIHFIRGDYLKSYRLSTKEVFNHPIFFSQLCILRITNQLALDDPSKFEDELAACINHTFHLSPTDHFWPSAMNDIKKRDKKLLRHEGIELFRNIITNREFSKIWFKLGLYINKEKIALSHVSNLDPKLYQSKKLRELIGILYYRIGEVEKARLFLEDIDSANAEVIRGNINLLEKKYEVAFGHFKLALKMKENSLNALERAIPLAWVLEQWDEGEKLLERFIKKGMDERKKLALEVAFKIRKKNIKGANRKLNMLEESFRKILPKEVLQMRSYVAIQKENNEEVLKYSSKACHYFDGLNCWLLMQNLLWDNIGKTIKRKGPIVDIAKIDIESLKSPAKVEPLKEQRLIDQRDIEELDAQLIKIDPSQHTL